MNNVMVTVELSHPKSIQWHFVDTPDLSQSTRDDITEAAAYLRSQLFDCNGPSSIVVSLEAADHGIVNATSMLGYDNYALRLDSCAELMPVITGDDAVEVGASI